MDILISGSKGFVGTHLCNEFEDFNIEFFDRKTKDIKSINSWLSYKKKDILIFLSSRTSIYESWGNPHEFITDNVQALHAALEYCKKLDVNLIYLSSFTYEIKESGHYSEKDKTKAYNPYALSKLTSEQLISFYSSNFNVNAIILRPFNIYGPGQKESFLIPHIFNEFKKGNIIRLQTTSPIRDYIYVKDIVRAIYLATIGTIKGIKVYNLSFGNGTSVSELVSLISKVLAKKYKIKVGGTPHQNKIVKTIGDSTLFRSDYNWEPEYDLISGIKACKEFYYK